MTDKAITVEIDEFDGKRHILTFGNADDKGNIYTLYNGSYYLVLKKI